jgi:hypothetical protein
MYGAVGFSYGGAPSAAAASGSSDSDADDGSDDERPLEDSEVATERAAAQLGIDNFAVMLRRAEREEAEMAEGRIPKPKCVWPSPVAAETLNTAPCPLPGWEEPLPCLSWMLQSMHHLGLPVPSKLGHAWLGSLL